MCKINHPVGENEPDRYWEFPSDPADPVSFNQRLRNNGASEIEFPDYLDMLLGSQEENLGEIE